MAVVDPAGPQPSPFGSNMIVAGPLVFLAGCIGADASGRLVSGTIQDRTRQALDNARSRLQYIGLGLEDVVSVTIYLSKYDEDFLSMNEAYIAAFPNGIPLPCRTCVGVAALPAGTDIELTCTAVKRA